jgi:long-chain acyl-CoA synthetase
MAVAPAKPAMEFEHRWWTWQQLTAIGQALDQMLVQNGIGPNLRVAGILRNRPEIAATTIQLITGGRCVVTLNPLLPDEKLAADILALRAPVLVALTQDWDRPAIRAAALELGCLSVELTCNDAEPVRLLAGLRGALEGYNARAEGIGIEMLSSGTTGTPKRIPLKTRNFERMILDTAVYESRDAGGQPTLRSGVQILNTPFSHIGGIFSLFTCVSAGRKACLLERFSVDKFIDAVKRHRPKAVGVPPTALRMILDANIPKEDLASVVVFRSGTAPLSPDLADAFFDRYSIPVLENYGATEFAGGVAGWTIGDFKKYHKHKRGSVGRMNPGVEAQIVDPQSGATVPFGTEGLLALRAAHLGDGASWVRTTDIAKMDADGFLWILGRHDNAIIRGGFKIAPNDIVCAMEAHPAILEASVVGIADARLGQVPAAAYIVKTGAKLNQNEFRDFLRSRLLPYQVPVHLLETSDLPRTPSMKVSQPELRKLFEKTASDPEALIIPEGA